jgi:regulator of RNase E activity RraA
LRWDAGARIGGIEAAHAGRGRAPAFYVVRAATIDAGRRPSKRPEIGNDRDMTDFWEDDADLFGQARRELFTSVVGDIMDKMGFRHQFLPPAIQPLERNMVTIGRAMTVLEADYFEEAAAAGHNPLSGRPFGLMLDALDDLKPNEVYTCTGGSGHYALWGELMSTRAIHCGAAGAVLDGYSRDTRGILELGFPTFSHGSFALDQGPRGKVVDYRVPIEMTGTRVEPGDIVFGDLDGVCVVPRAAEQDVFRGAYEKARGEKTVRKALEQGMSAREAFEKFGIL